MLSPTVRCTAAAGSRAQSSRELPRKIFGEISLGYYFTPFLIFFGFVSPFFLFSSSREFLYQSPRGERSKKEIYLLFSELRVTLFQNDSEGSVKVREKLERMEMKRERRMLQALSILSTILLGTASRATSFSPKRSAFSPPLATAFKVHPVLTSEGVPARGSCAPISDTAARLDRGSRPFSCSPTVLRHCMLRLRGGGSSVGVAALFSNLITTVESMGPAAHSQRHTLDARWWESPPGHW